MRSAPCGGYSKPQGSSPCQKLPWSEGEDGYIKYHHEAPLQRPVLVLSTPFHFLASSSRAQVINLTADTFFDKHQEERLELAAVGKKQPPKIGTCSSGKEATPNVDCKGMLQCPTGFNKVSEDLDQGVPFRPRLLCTQGIDSRWLEMRKRRFPLDSNSPFFSVRELHHRRGRLLPPSAAVAPSPNSRKEKAAVLDSVMVMETITDEEEVLLQNL
ncbi:hypothetical protein MRB53_028709 [Persea americana]|uniref:Uncharacterized protein n=1 Tax=Persea americana TaxID=3435 RepID=A0ACC2KGA3_PERAE|nr:hypothetical protein MRB53_028709 [Persea americana]